MLSIAILQGALGFLWQIFNCQPYQSASPSNEPVGDASVVPLIAVQLPGTRFIHARSEKVGQWRNRLE
jgi:hypothetical protein